MITFMCCFLTVLMIVCTHRLATCGRWAFGPYMWEWWLLTTPFIVAGGYMAVTLNW